jgi:hypothetical protein
MTDSFSGRNWLVFVVLAFSIVAAGWFVGNGFREGRRSDRFVTVKGVSERPAKADLALWPIRFVSVGNELSQVQRDSEGARQKVERFLIDAGIPKDGIEVRSIDVTDLHAQAYRSGPVENRFIIAQTTMIRTTDVARVAAASQRLMELVDAGVVLNNQGGVAQGPIYLFTSLNDIKPGMIAEATQRAREAAEQFAVDSKSRLAGIRRANQGLFQILPRDNVPGTEEQSQIDKTVRVVSTIEYGLED